MADGSAESSAAGPSRQGFSSVVCEAGQAASAAAGGHMASAVPRSLTGGWNGCDVAQLTESTATTAECSACDRPERSMLHVFSGKPRAGSFEDAAAEMAVAIDVCDTLTGGWRHDVMRASVRQQLLADVRAGKYEVVWLGTPCASFTRLWLSGDKRPPRSRRQPDGVDGLPGWQQRYVEWHNVFVRFTEELAQAAYDAGCTYVIENPVDYGQPGSPYFDWAAREHCPLWLTTPMRRLARATRAKFVSGCQCMLGGDFKKATTLMAAGPLADRLNSFGSLVCTHVKHTRVAFGQQADGRNHSADAAAYPVPMCRWAVRTLFGAEAVGAPGYTLRPEVQTAQRRAAELDAANAAAAAAFAASASDSTPVADGGDGCPDGEGWDDSYDGDDSGGIGEPFRWAAAPGRMPASWAEAADVCGAAAERERAAELRYISRRRAEPESAEKLARRAFENPHPVQDTMAVERPSVVQMPAGAPARPIRIEQLYNPGVYAEIREEIDAHADGIENGLADGKSWGKRRTRVWKAEECQPLWAQRVVWDCTDPEDCVPMQPFSADDPPQQGAQREFFAYWGARLAWRDHDMLRQVTETGVEGRSELDWATTIMSHHAGLRHNPEPAAESIRNDTAAGWMSSARRDLWTVPARLVPKNVVQQLKWRIDELGELRRKKKYRVTTDDSIEPEEEGEAVSSRNAAMARDWGPSTLTSPRTLAEAVAIVKSVAGEMGITASRVALEQIALWAIDLSDAYRQLAASRLEHWQQCFMWAGGVKVDLRCVFGAAHMVDFFQRVSTFVLAVAKERIHEYDRAHPYGDSREAWRAWRAEHLGGEQSATFQSIYLDDGSGLTPLGAGEPLRGAAPGAAKVTSCCSVETAAGGGTRVRLHLFGDKSRPEIHLAIVRRTFVEAGWAVADDKEQLGFTIDLLGLGITSEGDGCLFVTEAKRRGMRVDIAAQLAAPKGRVERTAVDEITGRCSHIGAVVCEGNTHLQPMYRFLHARWVKGGRIQKPRWLSLAGDSQTQRRYIAALQWWDAALERGVCVPLAPRLEFPELGSEGCAYFFTDAARENGTGYGGHTMVEVGSRLFFIFHEARWAAGPLLALQANSFSMPAGECFGAVLFADALVRALGNVTHLICFTDSDATAKAFTAAGSGAPQLNYLVEWLLARHPGLQLLGVHQPGVRNVAADRLSRTAEGRQSVLEEAAAAGAELVELQHSAADAAEAQRLLAGATACPLRR